jgi:hypothetical protein
LIDIEFFFLLVSFLINFKHTFLFWQERAHAALETLKITVTVFTPPDNYSAAAGFVAVLYRFQIDTVRPDDTVRRWSGRSSAKYILLYYNMSEDSTPQAQHQ